MEFKQHVDSALTTFVDNTRFFREIAEFVSDFSDGQIQQLLEESARLRVEHAENLIRVKSKHQSLSQVMQQVQNSSSTIEELEENWKKRSKAEEQKRINVKNIAEFKNFKKTVESAAGHVGAEVNSQANGAAQDEDLIIEGIEETGGGIFSLYDPWSKALMKNPVRNEKCGHIYDRDSVMLIIKDNIGIRCPVLGCGNTTYIQPAHLVEDAKVRQMVIQRMAEEIEDSTASEDDEEQADED
ncbi:E3 SUMO-protein ligase NSE2 [Drosophila erecta]|uniref:E3 SUMO-protein ligase NSE2 n=1 Tax=Drosophila erecta TaxID=7220 RepID=B3P7R3_DROER|nr:E3 SUMO-protein ligase NSE2 [Drosophila erecta]EDV52971.1 uncharacterized protein Dere_GG11876 [Drosophila erecta]